MKKAKFSLVFFLLTMVSYSQDRLSESLFWITTDSLGEWVNHGREGINYKIKTEGTDYAEINHQRVKKIIPGDYLEILDSLDYSQWSVFLVFKPKDKTEHNLWQITQKEEVLQKLSTSKIYKDQQESGYNSDSIITPMIVTYFQHERDKEKYQGNLSLLSEASQFNGEIAEFIVYDRVINSEERQQIETYLSLKYAISLASNVDYVGSQGETLWEKKPQQVYGKEVYGFGRSDAFAFEQYKSSPLAKGALSIELVGNETSKWADGEYLLWSSNNESLTFEEKEEQLTFLNRNWEIKQTAKQALAKLKFESSSWPTIEEGNSLWLVHEPSEDDTNLTFHKLSASSKGFHESAPLEIDTDQSGSDKIMVAFGSSLLTRSARSSPICASPQSGGLNLKIFGGQTPYAVILTKDNQVQQQTTQTNELDFDGLAAGLYEVEVTDLLGETSQTTVQLNHSDGPELKLATTYHLDPMGQLRIPIPRADEVVYKWYKDGDEIHRGKDYPIKQPGNYQLAATSSNGCENKARFEVLKSKVAEQKNLIVYPNPVGVSQDFSLRYDFTTPRDIQVALYDVDGKLMLKEKYVAEKYGHINLKINKLGVYILQVKAEDIEDSFKIIVK